MKKNLWIVNHYASRPDEPGIRHFALAKSLENHGWATTIFAASSQHYTGKQRLSGWKLFQTEYLEGVTYRWLRLPAYRGNGPLRILNMIGFTILLWFPRAVSGLVRPDAVIGSSVHPLAALGASVLAKRFGVPFYFEIRDLWPETLIQMGAIKRNGAVAVSMRALERHLCNRSEKVITTMPFADEYLEKQGISHDKVVWISNGVYTADFDPQPKQPGDTFDFIYFGALGSANNLETLISAFSLVDQSPQSRFRIVGAGPLESALRSRVAELQLEGRVLIEQPIPKNEIPALAAEADCLVLGLLPLALYEYGISLNKLYEYMAASRPIVFSGCARANPVESSGGGICTDGGVEANADALQSVLDSTSADRSDWGRLNREYAEQHFDFAKLAEILAKVLSQHQCSTAN